MKHCSNPSCIQTNPQPLENFGKNKKGKNGLYCHCKPCHRLSGRNRYLGPEGRFRRWRNSIGRYWPDLSIEQAFHKYMDLHEKQNAKCAICDKPETELDYKYEIVKMLSVDHCHSTGRVRGLLCSKCNRGIGQLNDCPILCAKASKYLKTA